MVGARPFPFRPFLLRDDAWTDLFKCGLDPFLMCAPPGSRCRRWRGRYARTGAQGRYAGSRQPANRGTLKPDLKVSTKSPPFAWDTSGHVADPCDYQRLQRVVVIAFDGR